MTTKSFLLATIAGTLVLFLLGYLFYGVIFHQDFDNDIITAQRVLIAPPRFAILILGNFIASLFLIFLQFNLRGIKNSSYAFVHGFVVFGMMVLYTNVILYGRTDILTIQGIFIDATILAIMGGTASFFIYYVMHWFKN